MYRPEERIHSVNKLAVEIENHILEGIANKRYTPNYVIEKNHDDGVVDAWVTGLRPVKKILTTVTLKKPLP